MRATIAARECFKSGHYREAEERDEEAGLGRSCVLCRSGIPGGSYVAGGHHEILSKAELPGVNNWETLFALENIAPACPMHHEKLGHLRWLWLKAMVATGLADSAQYRVPPFQGYWNEEDCPPFTCFGRFGFGSCYFQSHSMPESLQRLYEVAYRGFDLARFCEFCFERRRCQLVCSFATMNITDI